MPDVGISLEALLVLLFFVFAVPCVALGLVIRGMVRGYRVRRVYRHYRPEKSGRYA